MHKFVRRNSSLLGVAFGLVFAIIVVVLQQPDGIVLYTDEAGYTAPARVFAGVVETANLSGIQLYSAVYPLLLAPLVGLVHASPWAIAVFVNVGLVGVLVAICARIAFDLGIAQRDAWLVGLVGCVPSIVLQVPRAWPEVLLAVLVALWVRLIISGDERSLRWAGVLAALTFSVHNRMIGVLVAWLLFALFTVFRHPHLRLRFATSLVPIVAILVGARLLSGWVVEELYLGRVGRAGSRMMERASSPSKWDDVLFSSIGQIWTLSVGTLGLAVIGLVFLIRRALRGPSPVTGEISLDQRAAALAILAAFAATAVVAGLFLAESVARVDHLVYGRYLAVFGPALTALGVSWMRAVDRRQAVSAGLISCGSLLLFLLPLSRFGEAAFAGNVQKLVITGLLPFQLLFDEPHYPFIRELNVRGIALIVIPTTTFVVWLLTVRWRAGVGVIFILWVLLASAASVLSLRPFLDVWEPAADDAVELVGEARSVGRLPGFNPTALAAFEAEAGYAVTEVLDPAVCPANTEFVLAPSSEAAGFEAEVVAKMSPLGGVLLKPTCG